MPVLYMKEAINDAYLPDDAANFAVEVCKPGTLTYTRVSFRTEDGDGDSPKTELRITCGGGNLEVEVTDDPGVRLKWCGGCERDETIDALIALAEHLRVYKA